MLDQTDMEILKWLKSNSRMQWREIGEKVHMTGQAVGARIRRMEDEGIIKGFTVSLDNSKLGNPITALITVFMKTNDHPAFLRFIENREEIEECYRISGEGCYWLKASLPSHDELSSLLDVVLKFGNYRLNLAISKVR